MELRVGTSGFAYKEWLGNFYPEKLAAAAMLGYYSQRFTTVEINNTFYQLPKVANLIKWAGEVPDSFRFVLKASQRITHHQRLKASDDTVHYLTRTAREGLAERCGPLLFQLPPNFKVDRERLASFLSLLPPDLPAAFEFRHPSWHQPEISELLGEHGAALCAADTDEDPEPVVVVPTTNWGYLRLRRVAYDEAAMWAWVGKLAEAATAGDWREAYVFFKHEDEGTGPRFAAAFAAAWAARSTATPGVAAAQALGST